MTVLRTEMAKLAKGMLQEPPPGSPDADFTVSPASTQDAAAVLRFASDHRLRVLFWGGGTHQGLGHPVSPDIVMSTAKLDSVVDWQAEDLTIVVEPGVLVVDLEAQLEQRGQTAVLPESPGVATIGGVVASGLSGWRRLRYGPTRDRVLEVVLATGDGRVVRGGGRLVKNVTGYDLPRLATGSLGSLGLITSVCLKLWPLTTERAMFEVSDPAAALRAAFRPYAVIETNAKTTVYIAGTAAEIEAQAARIGSHPVPGHRWPDPLQGLFDLLVRVPAGAVADGVARIRQEGWRFQAAHGVGEIRLAVDNHDAAAMLSLREWAESVGGGLVAARTPEGSTLDPWGLPPDSLDLQRRVKAAFDPIGIANPGKLPGRI